MKRIAPAKVLVASLGNDLSELAHADWMVYSKYYPHATLQESASLNQFLIALTEGFHFIHLLCHISETGVLSWEGEKITCSELIDKMHSRGTLGLWIANNNTNTAYVKGFRNVTGKLNLVMTLNRGSIFSNFLSDLLREMAAGANMPKAWSKLVPQAPTSSSTICPSCIFVAGAPETVYVP